DVKCVHNGTQRLLALHSKTRAGRGGEPIRAGKEAGRGGPELAGNQVTRPQRRTWTTATSSAYNRRQPGEWSKWSADADPGRSRVHDTLYASASCSSLSSFPSAIASK